MLLKVFSNTYDTVWVWLMTFIKTNSNKQTLANWPLWIWRYHLWICAERILRKTCTTMPMTNAKCQLDNLFLISLFWMFCMSNFEYISSKWIRNLLRPLYCVFIISFPKTILPFFIEHLNEKRVWLGNVRKNPPFAFFPFAHMILLICYWLWPNRTIYTVE